VALAAGRSLLLTFHLRDHESVSDPIHFDSAIFTFLRLQGMQVRDGRVRVITRPVSMTKSFRQVEATSIEI
jgi:DUF1365 family protein